MANKAWIMLAFIAYNPYGFIPGETGLSQTLALVYRQLLIVFFDALDTFLFGYGRSWTFVTACFLRLIIIMTIANLLLEHEEKIY